MTSLCTSDLFIISSEQEGQRLDKLLTLHYPSFSRTYFQSLIEDGFVLLNGDPAKKRVIPLLGDEIEVHFQFCKELSLQPEAIPLDILYEDEHLIAVNKPVGMVVHPAPGHPTGTFVNALLAHCQDLVPTEDNLRPGIVHRLDKDTSGVLLAAKTTTAHQKLVDLFASRHIEKSYLAFCIGTPANQTIDAPIGRHPTRRKEMAVIEEKGREAISHLQTLAFDSQMSLVYIKPKTGRTHQIRVHLKHVGYPILGDSVYGKAKINEQLGVSRQLLHAYRLQFLHPITNCQLSLTAPLPDDMKEWIHHLCGNSFETP